MDEATLATLPPHLMAEARNNQQHFRYDRQRARDNFIGRMQEQIDAIQGRNEWGGAFGARGRQQN